MSSKAFGEANVGVGCYTPTRLIGIFCGCSLLAMAACTPSLDDLRVGCQTLDREKWVCFSRIDIPVPGEPLPFDPDSMWNPFVADNAVEEVSRSELEELLLSYK